MGGHRLNRAFTVIELLVVIVCISILAAMLYPAMAQGVTQAKVTEGVTKLRQIHVAYTLYRNDNNDTGSYTDAVALGLPPHSQIPNVQTRSVDSPLDTYGATLPVRTSPCYMAEGFKNIIPLTVDADPRTAFGQEVPLFRENTMTAFHPNCGTSEVFNPYISHLSTAVLLSGRIVTVRKPGDVTASSFYGPPSP